MDNNTKVIIGFPEITELRIGTAMRIAIMQYVLYNNRYDNIVPYEKLLYLLKNVKYYYRFKTVKNYSEYVLKFYLGEKYKINFEQGENFDKINKEFGSKKISIDVLAYLNNVVLPKIIKVALKNLNEETPEMGILTIKSSSFIGYYENSCEMVEEIIAAFCTDFLYYLEYHQIVHIPEFIITKDTKKVLVPIKFSFVNKL